ncbi:MAG TPA: hypothetical protein VHC22_16315 [Pirellulales bacterium]|nr:hypothetical protein [Pirellulales bacterium]
MAEGRISLGQWRFLIENELVNGVQRRWPLIVGRDGLVARLTLASSFRIFGNWVALDHIDLVSVNRFALLICSGRLSRMAVVGQRPTARQFWSFFGCGASVNLDGETGIAARAVGTFGDRDGRRRESRLYMDVHVTHPSLERAAVFEGTQHARHGAHPRHAFATRHSHCAHQVHLAGLRIIKETELTTFERLSRQDTFRHATATPRHY